MKTTRLVPALIVTVLAAASMWACRTPRPPKVVVIGLDGLTWKFLDPLLKDHQLPNLEGVINGAATGELETFRPTHSGILWTSIATGKTMQKHGITDWTFVDQTAREEIEKLRLVTGTRRTAATIWEILSDKGRKVEVVNWWVTYPARPVNGVVITDRLRAVMNKKSVPDEPDVVYPPALVEELKPLFFVAMSETTHPGSRAWLSGVCQQAGFTPRILQDVELESDLMIFVANGLGVTLAREQIKRLPHPGVVFRPLAAPVRADYWIVWHQANRSKSLQSYIEIVKKQAASLH
jgi:hypothetical protein